jgi:hypothetical protein
MDKTSELRGMLGKIFVWNKCRLDCFTKMLLALFIVRTINFSEIAVAMISKADVASRYKRLQRFFRHFRVDYNVIAKFIFNLFFAGKEIYITIDRTNWFWGKSKINILTLAVAYEGVAIPIFWCLLNKAGNATAVEHRAILVRFIRVFGKECILGVLADREFASATLFGFCNKNDIPFYIRIKEDSQVKIKNKKWLKAQKLFSHLNKKEKSEFQMTVWIYGQKVYLAGSRSETGELMIVATNKSPKNAIEIYLRRWEIECLFSCLKGRGFCFEETHVTDRGRIKKIMALLAIGFCWAHKTGEWRANIKPIRLCKHRESIRPQSSYMRYGLDYIRELLVNPLNTIAKFREIIGLFEPDSQLQGVVS